MKRTGLLYWRFQDDVLVLAPTRWKLHLTDKDGTSFAPPFGGVEQRPGDGPRLAGAASS